MNIIYNEVVETIMFKFAFAVVVYFVAIFVSEQFFMSNDDIVVGVMLTITVSGLVATVSTGLLDLYLTHRAARRTPLAERRPTVVTTWK